MNRRKRAELDEIRLQLLEGEVRVCWPDELPHNPRPILGGDVPLTNLCAGMLSGQISFYTADAVAFRDVQLAALAHALASFLGIDHTVFLPPQGDCPTDTSARTSSRPIEGNLLFLHGIIADENRVKTAELLSGGAGQIVAHASLLAKPELAEKLHIVYIKPIPKELDVNR